MSRPDRLQAMPVVSELCPRCGFVGGREACQALFDEVALRVRALAWTDSMKTWRLMHDVYDVQHEEDFCGRYRGLVMHLGGVCWALEHGGAERGYRALQKLIEKNLWEGQPYPPPPGIPKSRGTITIASLRTADDPERLINGVDRWARAVWLAYAELQPVARDWVQQALMLRPEGSTPGR
ncbi:MAG TPA: DUF5946 family protein [Vicinamibacterales bacterium]|nr:DUF5946 family protein [Vicinamibacterales bacterium]